MIVDEEENEMTLRNTVDSLLSEHEITLRKRWTHFK
jgi:hypothetical protein